MKIELTVNGRPVAADVPENTLLVQLLRDTLQLTGTHVGCDTAQCGACTVIVGDRAIKSCNVLAAQLQGAEVTTIEGVAHADGSMHPVQAAFLELQAGQCGYCVAGMIVSATALLRTNPHPTRHEVSEALDRNLCRCGTHLRFVDAVLAAAGSTEAGQ